MCFILMNFILLYQRPALHNEVVYTTTKDLLNIMYRKSKKKLDPLLLLSIFVGLGVIGSTYVQHQVQGDAAQRDLTDQEVSRDLSHTPITIKNESQSLDTDTLVKVTETLPRKPAKRTAEGIRPGDEAVGQNSITINETRVYRF